MSYTPLPFTFGVEIEHVLAIVRTTLYEAYRHESAERLGHNKPALFVLPEGEVDGYNPLQTLHLKLKHNGLDAKFHEEDGEEEDRRSDYGTWNVTSDSSIRYDISRQQMEAEFQKARPSASRHGRWRLDSDYSFEGVELVSPPLRVPDIDGNSGGMDEVTRYLDVVLNGFTINSCGGHVHLGLPDNQAIPTPLLQHLAYILLRYEPLISTLHHHTRTPFPDTPGEDYAESNRIGFQEDLHSDCKYAVPLDWPTIRKRVFEGNIEIGKLSWLMGLEVPVSEAEIQGWTDDWNKLHNKSRCTPADEPVSVSVCCTTPTTPPDTDTHTDANPPSRWPKGSKYKITRWTNLPRHPSEGPRTIEFRQAIGTLDARETTENVRLYVALLREAERRMYVDLDAKQPTGSCTEDSDIDVDVEAEDMCLPAFLAMLRLPGESRGYWIERAGRDATGRDASQLADREKCIACEGVCVGL